jgi:malate synthase
VTDRQFEANQLTRPISGVRITAADLLTNGSEGKVPVVTLAGVRDNLDVGLEYLESWLRGNGCVPLNNLMEDAATAEIARCQIWQWIRHRTSTAEGVLISQPLVRELIAAKVAALKAALGEAGYAKRRYTLAAQLYERLLLGERLEDFLTLVAYPHIVTITGGAPAGGHLSKL